MMVDAIVVGLIVGAALLYVAGRWLPAALRHPLARGAARAARRAGLPGLAARLEPKAGSSGCGSGCANCGDCPQPLAGGAPATAAAPAPPGPSERREIRIRPV